MKSNFDLACNLILYELTELAANVPADDRDDFFDGRNRNLWMDSFIDRLRIKYQQPDRITSND